MENNIDDFVSSALGVAWEKICEGDSTTDTECLEDLVLTNKGCFISCVYLETSYCVAQADFKLRIHTSQPQLQGLHHA